jgi:hypothetical protein
MLPGGPGGGRTPEGAGPRVHDTRRRAGAEIDRRMLAGSRAEARRLTDLRCIFELVR